MKIFEAIRLFVICFCFGLTVGIILNNNKANEAKQYMEITDSLPEPIAIAKSTDEIVMEIIVSSVLTDTGIKNEHYLLARKSDIFMNNQEEEQNEY